MSGEEEPLELFLRWLDEAEEAGVPEPRAMALATADPRGRPSVRIVILRGADERGLRFFTSYESPKARDLDANPRAAVAFNWPEVHRQVRGSGPVVRLPPEESDAYFASRPRGHRLAVWAAEPQSQPLRDRAQLERRYEELEREHAASEVKRPASWGGYLLEPDEWEFWVGRENRLHDRLRYRRDPPGGWTVERLRP
jgi:pyridoxamine 5'-phosphate oxidase